MATYNDTFQRKEVKYRLTAQQLRAVLAVLEGRMTVDRYGDTVIESRYYDTPQRELIERSLDKPLYKEKLRLRSYGPLATADTVYVELKKKFKGIVYKRRIGMSKAAAAAFLAGMDFEKAATRWPLTDAAMQQELLSSHGRQIAAEISAFCTRYPGLAPSMDISVIRRSYQVAPNASRGVVVLDGAPSTDLRITFDTHLRACDLMRDGRPVYELAGRGEAVMEVKCAGAYPAWLVDALSQNGIYPQSFSKYGEAYRLSFLPVAAAARTAAARTAPAAASAGSNVAALKGSASCLKAS